MSGMAVLINWRICDNSKDCSGIACCPTGAFSWDGEGKSIRLDNSKCVSCGKCAPLCPVGAIRVARNDEEYARIEEEIKNDPRKVSDLFVDRYGAMPLDPAFLIDKGKFGVQILEAGQLAVVEFYNDSTIQCLLHSIPVKELFGGLKVKYRKIKVEKDDELLRRYGISALPSLAFFENGKLKGKIEGYRDKDGKEKLRAEIGRILS
jgi:NAD-dependent dihydropyrimidine dehydrogenase PreA subunit